jgi:hypothetical protein
MSRGTQRQRVKWGLNGSLRTGWADAVSARTGWADAVSARMGWADAVSARTEWADALSARAALALAHTLGRPRQRLPCSFSCGPGVHPRHSCWGAGTNRRAAWSRLITLCDSPAQEGRAPTPTPYQDVWWSHVTNKRTTQGHPAGHPGRAAHALTADAETEPETLAEGDTDALTLAESEPVAVTLPVTDASTDALCTEGDTGRESRIRGGGPGVWHREAGAKGTSTHRHRPGSEGSLQQARREILQLPYTALPNPALPCPALPCPALPCPALPCTALHCTALAALHCTALPSVPLRSATHRRCRCRGGGTAADGCGLGRRLRQGRRHGREGKGKGETARAHG